MSNSNAFCVERASCEEFDRPGGVAYIKPLIVVGAELTAKSVHPEDAGGRQF